MTICVTHTRAHTLLFSSGLTLEWNSDAKVLMPLGQMPVLEVDGQKFCQQSAIARFLAKRFGLMGDDELQVGNGSGCKSFGWRRRIQREHQL